MTRLVHFASAAVLPLALLACDKEQEGEDRPADGMPYCEDTVSFLDPADAPFGLTGEDFLAAVPAELDGGADFEGMDSSALAIDIDIDAASLRFVESQAVYPQTSGPVPDIAVICPDRMEVDATMALSTADGQLAETLDLVLVVSHEEGVEPEMRIDVSTELDLDALEGSFDIASYTDPDRFDTISMSLFASIYEGQLSGEINATGSAVNGSTASAERIFVAVLDATSLD